MNAHDKAVLLITEVRAALKNGTKHFDIHGNSLTTELEILTALRRDGEIKFEPTPSP